MSGGDERLDLAFRARLREALVTQATEGREVSRAPHLAWGLVAGVCLVAAVGTTWVLRDPGAESTAGGLEMRSVDVICAGTTGPEASVSGSGGALTSPRGIMISVAIAGGAKAEPELLDRCARLWDDGQLAGVEMQNSTPQSRPASGPALALCSLDGGTPIVVPAPDCRAAGMAEWVEKGRPGS